MMNINKAYVEIKRILEDYIFDNIYEGMSIIDILILMCKDFYSQKCDLSYERKYNKVVLHSLRVYNNVNTILGYLESKGKIFTLEEKEDLLISSIFHDVGKLYKDSSKNHPILGKYIMCELFKKVDFCNERRKNNICDMIAYHGNKRHNRDKISYLTKILRDADLFDEVCGDSLLELALENIIGKGDPMIKNLNHNEYKFSDMIIMDRNDTNIKREILEKINIEENKGLYLYLLKEATDKYKQITNWEVRYSKQVRGLKLMDENTIRININ